MIKTKSVYHDKIEDSDGVRILVMRRWCRPLSKEKAKIDEWLKELGPSPELLADWNRKTIGWPEYKKRYLKEIEAQVKLIKNLTERAKKETITAENLPEQDHIFSYDELQKVKIPEEKINKIYNIRYTPVQ